MEMMGGAVPAVLPIPQYHPPPFAPPVMTAAAPLPSPYPPQAVPPSLHNNTRKHHRYQQQDKEHVRTLFISGLPEDIKQREIYNLFRRRLGFETCQLKYTGRGYQIVAFAVFSDQHSAMAAKDALNGLKFDPETGATLHIEFARANSRIKRSRTEYGGYGSSGKKVRGPVGTPDKYKDAGVDGTVQLPGMIHSGFSDIPTQSGGTMGTSFTGQGDNSDMTVGQPTGSVSNRPCPTLFVANLGPTCTEEELNHVFSMFPGFQIVKMQTKGGMPVAFVDFQDSTCSTEALNKLQNSLLPSSDRGGMHLEYAKSRMRRPRQDRQLENDMRQNRLLENEMRQVFPFSFCDEA